VVIDNVTAYFMACNVLSSNNYDEINCSIHHVTCCLADAPLSYTKMDAKHREHSGFS